ncbi:hypothetical protein HDU90_008186 [Geranomyces variabilis]|nr:hypothetical protein HDU90_008186 [Geranomyces variabilis]
MDLTFRIQPFSLDNLAKGLELPLIPITVSVTGTELDIPLSGGSERGGAVAFATDGFDATWSGMSFGATGVGTSCSGVEDPETLSASINVAVILGYGFNPGAAAAYLSA